MNVIIFPKSVNNNLSKWSIYEKSYLNLNYLNEYEINDLNLDLYQEEFNKILEIKNNFFNIDENLVLNKLLSKLNSKFIKKYKDDFSNKIINYINTEKLDNFVLCFLKTLKYDKERITIITDYINNIVNINLIYNLKIINQIIIELEKINDMEEIISIIHLKVSKNISQKFLNFVFNTDLSVLSNLFKKINLFKKFYNKFDLIEKVKINKEILKKIILNLNNKNISNNTFANIIIELFNFLKNNEINEIIDIDCNLLLDYLNASIYFWILDNSYIKIESLIIYSYNYLPKLNFLEFYKSHLQNRALIINNFDVENKLFNKIIDMYENDAYNNIICEIKYILDDMLLSNLCKNEISNMNVNVKYNFKNVNFDLKKINLLICSNNLWNNNKNLYDKIKYVDTIGVYECILNKFYESKYSKKRKLNISNEESIININLWKNTILMPLTYYNLLYKIGDCDAETSINTFNYLKDSLNYDNDYCEKILNIFKSKNLIMETVFLNDIELNNYIKRYYENGNFKSLEIINFSNIEFCNNLNSLNEIIYNYINLNMLKVNNRYKLNKKLINLLNLSDKVVYVINEELENQQINLNLVNVKRNDKRILDKIEYDRNLLLDSKIGEIFKKYKELKYGKFILNLRNSISKFFIPSEKEILSRLERLIILGYIKQEGSLYMYIE